jgi:hypothetical protein
LWVYSNTESAGGAADAQVWVESGGTHFEITRASADYNTIIANRPHGGIIQGSGFWNNVEDIPQWWAPITEGTPLVDIPNWSTHPEGDTLRCNFMRPYKNFLMMGNLGDPGGTGNIWPYTVRWSHPIAPGATPTSFDVTDPSTLANEFDLAETSDYIVDGLTLGEIFVVYKEFTTWGLQFVGGDEVMRRWKIFDDSGILWRDCMATWPQGHYVVTQTDIIVHNGTKGSERSILEKKLRNWLFSLLNTVEYKNCFCVTIEARKEIWFFFPDGGSTYANRVLFWNWTEDTVGIRDLPAPGIPHAAVGIISDAGGEPTAWGA